MFSKKDDYLNLRLTRRERELLIKFGEKFVNDSFQDRLFDKKNVTLQDIKFLDSKFLELHSTYKVPSGINYYKTNKNYNEVEEFDNILNILVKRTSNISGVGITNISKLFVETLLYLKIIEL